MLAAAQKSGKAHTSATEFRENRLAITENTEKKDVYMYLSPFHVNPLMACEDKLFGSILRNCQAENVLSRWNSIILVRVLVPVVQFESKLRSH